MRKIPATMATQHPDNACAAYFTGKRFLSVNDEIEECVRSFSELNIEEYMWDWEGKFVDEAVIDRLFNKYHSFFSKKQIGRDVFLTFRVPNIWLEPSHKLPRAFMNMITAENAAKTYKMHTPPLFEVILPMTTSAEQLIYLQKTFSKISKATKEIFEMKSDLKRIDVIPLFEKFETLPKIKSILKEYIDFLKKEYHFKPQYMRTFTARSDTAMNSGFLPAKLFSKQAISLYHEFGEEEDIKMYPWVGGGALPFRGGINPENIDAVLEEYKGVATLTLQSAFRYDYPLKEVKKAIKKLNEKIPENRKKYIKISEKEQEQLNDFNNYVSRYFKSVIEPSAEMINHLGKKLPQNRERMQHVGLFGYSRGEGKVKLPRAIIFTGALYSLGVSPELIGQGRALLYAKKKGMLDLIKNLCPYLIEDFRHAGHYLNRENLDLLCKKNDIWKEVRDEIKDIEKIIGVEIGQEKPSHIIHRNLTSNIYQQLISGEDFSEDALRAAEIRKSLG